MENYTRRIGLVGISLASLLYSGCGKEQIPANPAAPLTAEDPNPNQYEQRIRQASTLTIKEKFFSLGKHYDIYDGKEIVATVTGKKFRVISGDLFTLKTIDGKVLGSEKESVGFLQFKRAAACYDGHGKNNGYIGEEISLKDMATFDHIFHLYDPEKTQLGKSRRAAISGTVNIKNTSGGIDYLSEKKFLSSTDKYILQKKNKESKIPIQQAILITCIEDTLRDAEKAEATEKTIDAISDALDDDD